MSSNPGEQLPRTGLVWHERYMWHDTGRYLRSALVEPTDHFEHAETKRRIKNLLDYTGLTDRLVRLDPRKATIEELGQVHDPEYINRIRELSDSGSGDAGDATPFGAGSFEIARLATGGVIVVIDAVMANQVANAYALVRPPGHHAERGRGYCLFSNVAVAARYAQRDHALQRIAIVDWDVHHGNGTEQAFYHDPDVLTVSIHQDGLYPEGSGAVGRRGDGPGAGRNINVPLPAGSGHGAYLATFDRVVAPCLEAFRPDLIIVASGFDACVYDPLAVMGLAGSAFRDMTARILSLASELCEGRLVFAHEGGYSRYHAPFCGLAVIEALSGEDTGFRDPFETRADTMRPLLPHQTVAIDAALRGLDWLWV